jgi:hypothetical protein
MKMLRLSAVMLSTLLISPTYSQTGTGAAAAPAGSTAGKAIGTAISTAITTAFPAISTIIHAIWPTNPNQNKRQSDATSATASLQQQSTQQLAQLAKLSGDLSVVTVFLSNCVVAENNIVAMRTYLQGKTTLNDTDKLTLQNYWNLAKGRLTNLKSAGSSIDGLDDPNIATTLRAVADANSGLVDNVSANLNASSITLLNPDLATLDSQLSAVNALSGEIIGEVSVALKTVQTKAAGAEGTPELTSAFQQAQQDLNDGVTRLKGHSQSR